MENNSENRKNTKSGGGNANTSTKTNADPILDEVLNKIQDAESVLVALSNDPTVDEIAAAMGLSMALDNIGKHVTAIYSGKTPNVLEFLKPRERFETGTESLQDFVIALNKDKADHLRYKIDGDFVKVYVTPYKTTISGDDLEFSRGDYNVDLVIALNVPAATELDAALKEHGRIMHDASSINITNGAEGKFGDVEWVDSNASSISEMVSKLAFAINPDMDDSTATALLTGLVAATDRFKNPETTPDAMALAAKLMGAGADQQLVVQNVQGEVVFNGEDEGEKNVVVPETDGNSNTNPEDATKLEINHGEGAEEQTDEVTIPDIASANTPEIRTSGGVTLEPDATGVTEENQENKADQTAEIENTDTVAALPTIDTNETEPETSVQETSETETSTGGLDAAAPVGQEENNQEAGASALTANEADERSSVDGSVPESGSLTQANPLVAVDEKSSEANEAVRAAMAEAMGPAGAADAPTNNGTVAGVDVAVVPENADGYAGGEIADQILNGIEKENSNVGSTDYGKMIDDALSEPLPGEGGIQVGENGPNGATVGTQDVDQADVPEGNLMAMMEDDSTNIASDIGAKMMANAGAGLEGQQVMTDIPMNNPVAASTDANPNSNVDMGANMIPPQPSGMSEEEALDLIKQGQAEAEASLPGITDGGEMPKIITGGGMGLDEAPVGMDVGATSGEPNPAMAQTPGVEATEAVGVPEMNFQGEGGGSVNNPIEAASSAMPLPGQEIAPPPVAPMPDFGAMPPTNPDMAQAVDNTAVDSVANIQTSSATVQPDATIPENTNGLPQMPQVAGDGMMATPANPSSFPMPGAVGSGLSDPGAFKIPGIHT